ncbi:MAG: flavin-containing monooxygenase [Pseudomonadales bacterium]
MNEVPVDLLIIGAGISGIGAAYHLQKNCPGKSYSIIEARSEIGGTWDLFRYPGIRSDSSMYTFGYIFKPWVSDKAISPGEDIRQYLNEAATENGIRENICFNKRLTRASWCSKSALWSCTIENPETNTVDTLQSRFLFYGGGYYNYQQGYTPEFKDRESFNGTVIHPQHWPQSLDYSDKNIVVIGSGATAVTLVPTLAQTAKKVTMLQRSPTYIVAMPEQDVFANRLKRFLPARLAYQLARWKGILYGMYTFQLARRKPHLVKQFLINAVKEQLGEEFDIETHFTPSYNPWDQRLCLVPNGDLFKSIKNGSADVVTDHIDCFTDTGIQLKSGEHLPADIIVTATGLNMEVCSGLKIYVDDSEIDFADTFSYKGMMLSGIPNFAFSMGYTNASWTLKSDLISAYFCKLINHIDENGLRYCQPVLPADGIEEDAIMDFSSGYVMRAMEKMPKQGKSKPWRLYQNYVLDKLSLGLGSVQDPSIHFG